MVGEETIMKRKKWNQIMAFVLTSVMIAGSFLGESRGVTAAEIVSDSEAAVVGTETVCETEEEAVDYLRSQMVVRTEEISFLLNTTVYESVSTTELYNEAVSYSEECSGQEGDALKH